MQNTICVLQIQSPYHLSLYLKADDSDKNLLEEITFGYTKTYGSDELRAIASTYKTLLLLQVPRKGYLLMKSILNAKSHAIVITPNYQSSQTIPESICDVTS